MSISRRAFLQTLVVAAAASGCSQVVDRQLQPDIPQAFQPVGGVLRHPTAHLLNRAAYGARPGDIQTVIQMGHEAWIEQQLDYEALDTSALDLRLRRYDTLTMTPRDLLGFTGTANKQLIRDELAAATLLRAVYSPQRLYEVMVGFWSEHFSLYHYKTSVAQLKTVDDRDVIRPHALGKFKDLLVASAHSPAMLVYLDNVMNRTESINENYAREIMELHTLGIHGGYTEDDIKEVAKCFSGWTVNGRGAFEFVPEYHVFGEKQVLGYTIRSDNPQDDGNRVLEILSAHPNTAQFVCTKLVRRFVADDPPAQIVDHCVNTWNATEGDLRAVVRALLTHEQFNDAPLKLRRPFEFTAALLRVTNASYNGHKAVLSRLEAMGHRPFGYPTPDGYPDTATAWTGSLLNRWNLCIDAFSGIISGVSIDTNQLVEISEASPEGTLPYLGRLLLSRDLTSDELSVLEEVQTANGGDIRQTLAILAASPAFQWC